MRSFDVLLNGWTAIVPGNFGGDETTDLLFYASQAGVGEFFCQRRERRAAVAQRQRGLHDEAGTSSCPATFDDDDWTDLFFYNADAEEGKFYTTDGTGRITPPG